jgi:hypothetical protein
LEKGRNGRKLIIATHPYPSKEGISFPSLSSLKRAITEKVISSGG